MHLLGCIIYSSLLLSSLLLLAGLKIDREREKGKETGNIGRIREDNKEKIGLG